VDVLALILACSLHPDDALVRVLVDVQSSGNIYFVGDLVTLKMNDNLTSADDGLRVAEEFARHGGRPAVGLLGVPLDWAARFGRSPRDLFDACTNIAIGSAVFSEYQAACAPAHVSVGRAAALRPRTRAPSQRRLIAAERACVLTRFAHDLGLRGAPAEVLKRTVATEAEHSEEEPAQRSSVFGDGIDDGTAQPPNLEDSRVFVDARPIAGDLGANAPLARPSPSPQRPARSPSVSPRQAAAHEPQPIRVIPGPLPLAAAAASSATHR
jgi:hypothetical protein